MPIAGLVALAVVDSINPSAIVITLYLLTRSRAPAQVAVYIAAIFVTYFGLGTMMMLGLDTLAPSRGSILDSRPRLIAQSVVGLAVLVYSVTASTDASASARVAMELPIALLVGHLVLGPRIGARYDALGQRLQRAGRETALWISGLVGGAVFVTGLIELVARWR